MLKLKAEQEDQDQKYTDMVQQITLLEGLLMDYV